MGETNENITNTASTEVPSTADNSSSALEYTQEAISQALEEPETKETEDKAAEKTSEEQETQSKKQVQDNTQSECPDKFKNEDGSVNLGNLLKSYKELEPLVQAKAQWTKERAELLKSKEELDRLTELQNQTAKNAGYDTMQDMQQVYATASAEANEYAKYLQYTDNPEAVRQMLINYMNNPTKELMNDIELEFSPEINKRAAIVSERLKQEYEAQKQKQVQTAKMSAIEDVISKSVDSNKELFNYAPFKQLFINALHTYGDKFTYNDAKILMDTMVQMKEAYKSEFEKQTGTKIANEAATDKLAAINTQNYSAPAASQITAADIDKMSQAELAKEIRKYL